jgi:hypothetical protein
MALVMFPNDGQRASYPRASIYKNGIIGFTSGASRLFELNKYKFCILYYDADEKKIIVVLSNDEKNPAAVTLRSKISGSEITCSRFFSFFNILPTDRILCEIEAGEKPGSLVLDMKNAVKAKNNYREKK